MAEMSAEERAERALRHAPFLGQGKEAVLPLVEIEIRQAEQAARRKALEEATQLVDNNKLKFLTFDEAIQAIRALAESIEPQTYSHPPAAGYDSEDWPKS